MKTFHFSLQSLRVLREQKERLAQQRYADALRASETATVRLGAAGKERAAAWQALGAEVLAGVNGARLQQVRAWCRQWEQRCEQLGAALKAAEKVVGRTRQEVLLATRDRKALDNLHDQRRRAYDQAVRRGEQNHLDEMGLRASGSPAVGLELRGTPQERI